MLLHKKISEKVQGVELTKLIIATWSDFWATLCKFRSSKVYLCFVSFFSCRTESAAALEKTKKGEEGEGEGDVRDISNLFQNYSGNDILRISGGYLGAFLEYLEFTFYVIRGSGSFWTMRGQNRNTYLCLILPNLVQIRKFLFPLMLVKNPCAFVSNALKQPCPAA